MPDVSVLTVRLYDQEIGTITYVGGGSEPYLHSIKPMSKTLNARFLACGLRISLANC